MGEKADMTKDEVRMLCEVGVENVSVRCGECYQLSPSSDHECFIDATEFVIEKVWLGGNCGWLVTISVVKGE